MLLRGDLAAKLQDWGQSRSFYWMCVLHEYTHMGGKEKCGGDGGENSPQRLHSSSDQARLLPRTP